MRSLILNKIHFILVLGLVIFFTLPFFALAQSSGCATDVRECLGGGISATYTPMITIPGVTTNGTPSFADYANTLYGFAIVAAALLAVIRLVIAGAKYMTSDVVSSKSAARSDIEGSLLGLLIIIAAVIILQTINPNLANIGLGINQQGQIGGIDVGSIAHWVYSDQRQSVLGNNFDCDRDQIVYAGQCFDNPNCDADSEKTQFSLSASGVASVTCVPNGAAPGSLTQTKKIICIVGGGCPSMQDWENSADSQGIYDWCSSLGTGNGTYSINPIDTLEATVTCSYN